MRRVTPCWGGLCLAGISMAVLFYLDDFPSPVPSGASEYIQRDYGISVKDFYTNVGWPDLLKL